MAKKRKPKRNANGRGNLRQRKDGRWEGRFTAGRNPGTGRQIQKSVYGETQQEASKKLTQAIAAFDSGEYIELSRLTLTEWLDIWLSEYNKHIKPRTLNLYIGQCKHRIKPELGAIKLSALKPHEIQKFINKQSEGKTGKRALSPKSVKNIYGILHKALEQAVSVGYIKTNPAKAVKLPRITKPVINPLDSEQIALFLKAIKGHKYELLYIFVLFTGLRQGEILGLTWDCIQGETIFVHRQLQRINGKFHLVTLKNDKTRRITPAAAIMSMLKEHKAIQIKWKEFAGEAWDNGESFVFTNELGRHLIECTVYDSFKRIVSKMGIPGTRFHDLRHSYAVAALQAGDDVKTVQENLGHHTAAFTLDVYGHVTHQMKRKSAERMNAYITDIYRDM